MAARSGNETVMLVPNHTITLVAERKKKSKYMTNIAQNEHRWHVTV